MLGILGLRAICPDNMINLTRFESPFLGQRLAEALPLAEAVGDERGVRDEPPARGVEEPRGVELVRLCKVPRVVVDLVEAGRDHVRPGGGRVG